MGFRPFSCYARRGNMFACLRLVTEFFFPLLSRGVFLSRQTADEANPRLIGRKRNSRPLVFLFPHKIGLVLNNLGFLLIRGMIGPFFFFSSSSFNLIRKLCDICLPRGENTTNDFALVTKYGWTTSPISFKWLFIIIIIVLGIYIYIFCSFGSH